MTRAELAKLTANLRQFTRDLPAMRVPVKDMTPDQLASALRITLAAAKRTNPNA